MTFLRKPSQLTARLAMIALCVIGTMAVAAAAPQHALASSCSSWSTSGQDGYTQITFPDNQTCYGVVAAHVCHQQGTSDIYSANECADLDINYTPDSIEVWSEGEYYCQTTDGQGYSQCSYMKVDNILEWDPNSSNPPNAGHPGGFYVCSGSGCPAAGRAMVATYHETWDVAGGGCTDIMESYNDQSNTLTLPNGVSLPADDAANTGDYQFCL